MEIKHPNLKLAVCCLLAATLLPACGGSSSTSASAGGTGSRTYQQGYAAGTVATLDIVLEDLRAVQASLAGSGAPAQTSRGLLGRSFASLEPRQRATLAASLLSFITRVTEARDAAAATTAGTDEARAAQEAADDALRALQLVITADTAERAGGDEQVQTAAINALNQITRVDVTTPGARDQIDEALNNALRAARTEVADLERQLAAAQAAVAQAGTAAGTAAETITRLQASLTTAQNNLNALTARFGSSPGFSATGTRTAGTTYHARRTGATIYFGPTFDPTGSWSVATAYTLVNRGTAVTGGFDLTPDPVVYNPAGSNRRVFTTTSPNTSHFPGRGKVYRGEMRHLLDGDTDPANNTNRRDWLYGVDHRLVEQGVEAEACSGAESTSDGTTCWGGRTDGNSASTATNAGFYNNWDAPASMTFQYKSDGGFTMGFGGEGVIFGDLERYTAKGQKNCGSGGDEYCDEPNTANVEISFGAPSPDPYGESDTNYWNVQVPSPRLPANDAADSQANAATFDLTQPGDQIADHDFGQYELLLSNYAGASRRLAYAAYGLFNFVDFTTHNPRIGRMQLFHYGLDAFADRDGRRPTDLTGSNTIEGTFRGHTTAYIVTSRDKKENHSDRHENIQNLFRARGEIELRACIGAAGTSCTLQNFADTPSALAANTIAGSITELEYAFHNRPGFHWTKSPAGGIEGIPFGREDAKVRLDPASIQNDGSFSGRTAGDFTGGGTRRGTYEGAFYGPAGAGLETAGTWRLNAAAWEGNEWDAVIGSFGAVCEGTCRAAPSP